jgi:hypothetical protein
MTMSDRLAEVIYQAAFDRHVLIDRTDCAALAAAARAFIGDEIHEELRRSPGGGALWQTGMYGAGSIARGDTK